MYLFVGILDKEEDLEKIIAKFREIGVAGATIFDSIGLGPDTLHGQGMPPVIASLHGIFDREKRIYNHTIFSVIESKETLDKAFQAAEDVCGDFNRADVGILFSVELDRVVGYCRPDRDCSI